MNKLNSARKPFRGVIALLCGIGCLQLIWPDPAFAVLGGSELPLQAKLKQTTSSSKDGFSGKMKVSEAPLFKVYEYDSDTTHIREYASPSGIIFGIAWDGFTHPNIQSILGKYSSTFHTAEKKRKKLKGQRSQRSLKSEDLVFEQWGHMRKLQGRVYDPTLLPAGVNPHDIQ